MANALIHDVLEHDVDFTSMGFIAFEGIKEGQEVSYWHVIFAPGSEGNFIMTCCNTLSGLRQLPPDCV